MVVAFVLLVLWGLLFIPLGLVVHWSVLGPGARQRAVPLAAVTGVATTIVLLAVLGRFGIDAGSTGVAWTFVALAGAAGIAIWRCAVPWRSRDLIATGSLVVLAAILIQLPVIGEPTDGPLGYGTAVDPVSEVAAVDAASHGPASERAVARRVHADADERPIGFEQFAALTVALGQSADSDDLDETWTAYTLHAPITGILAVLVALPLLAFARARGVGWFGLTALIPLGVLAPCIFLALANGAGAAVATVPLTTAAIFSLLVTRRDRGWWVLAVIFGAAVAATGGVLALVPLLVVGASWVLLRSDTYEHLAADDAPTGRVLPTVVAGVTFVLGAIAVAPTLRNDGVLLAWSALHTRLIDAARSWPFAWLDTDLSTAGPTGPLETAIWLVGPALLVVAGAYAITRNERRELGVLVGMVVASALGLAAGIIEPEAGIELFEYTVLVLAPLLAALVVRGVSLARSHADDMRRAGDAGRWSGQGPVLLILVFGVLSIAATAATGTRMVHAPELSSVRLEPGSTLIAAGDPWLPYVVDGERASPSGAIDADALAPVRPESGTRSIVWGRAYDKLVLSSSPLSSDPSLRYRESSTLDAYQARLFYDRAGGNNAPIDVLVDGDRILQRVRAVAAESGDSDDDAPPPLASIDDADNASTETESADTDPNGLDTKAFIEALGTVLPPTRHDALEEDPDETTPDRPAGLLLPENDLAECEQGDDVLTRPTCKPAEPASSDCTPNEIDQARSNLDASSPASQRRKRAVAAAGADDPQVVRLNDQGETQPANPRLLGVRCFTVEVDSKSRVLGVHLRDVGVVLAPERADVQGTASDWSIERDDTLDASERGGLLGGIRRVSAERDATLAFGNSRLSGSYDLVLEGAFGAGIEIGTAPTPAATEDSPGSGQPSATPDFQLSDLGIAPVVDFRGAADGFSEIARQAALQGTVFVRNGAGTDVEIGRLFARPRDLPRSCDIPIAIEAGQRREVHISSNDERNGGLAVRPGISVTVLETNGSGSSRTARIAVGSYLAHRGLPRTLLVDWTEQFRAPVDVEGCDGALHSEAGAAPPRVVAGSDVVPATDALDAFGAGD